MNTISNSNSVKQQYSSTNNLNARTAIHKKYSTNKQGFGNWIFEHYNFKDNNKILEIGCGNGDIWKTNYVKIPSNVKITITDFFPNMLETAKKIYLKIKDLFIKK